MGAQISHLAIDFLPSIAAILQLLDDHGDDDYDHDDDHDHEEHYDEGYDEENFDDEHEKDDDRFLALQGGNPPTPR